jgi:CRISPR-associated protein Cmr4
MYEAKSLMFLYCVSPVHMGAGQALGVVDNPIQRERHTGHPVFAGSGIKGALRDDFEAAKGKDLTNRIFGPETDASDHAGCVAFSDAQLVLFPVRSLRESYVYATCPTALGRLRRMALLAGVEAGWAVPDLANDELCLALADSGLFIKARRDNKEVDTVTLEAFQFTRSLDTSAAERAGEAARWIADRAVPAPVDPDDPHKHFREKIRRHLVVLSDTRFSHFVENATLVEPHVRINDESGTADDGGLFYTENVPPEAVFVATFMASKARVKRGESDAGVRAANEVMEVVAQALHGRLVQLGGDATSGRGLMLVNLAGGR